MAEEARATGTGRLVATPSRAQRRAGSGSGNGADRGAPPRLAGPAAPWARTPRNAPCPCGSGKKYKHCHGRV
jgi:preprotein translocase subunit SecA